MEAWRGGHMNAAELTKWGGGGPKNLFTFLSLGFCIPQIVFGAAAHSELDFQDKPSCHSLLMDNGIYL